ncbi:MAG TPA: glycosyltransferase family 39 protein [Aggregatilinea sp.]|uniref:ArnT family glycosyltransferase n=1 Tax=Aggregatilinea sp. TaxID=2806333 RepID=UPI002CE9C447|nr:glycosyltransferase family 39 protein [Aggregatilinea sp.]HML23676.1 glycosyltransferase family 39 protein [Aggregatilinea sp.]
MLKRLTPRHWLALILLVTLLGRVAFLVLFGDSLALNASGYDVYAVNVMDGHGYTRFDDRSGDSDLPPLYPYFLVAVYSTLGRDPIAVAAVQIVFDLITVTLLYLIGRRVAGEAVGLLTGAFYGLYPYLLFQNLSVNDTGIFILLLTVGIWLAYRVRDTERWPYAVALGIAFGVAALTKTFVLLTLPMLALWWWRSANFRMALRNAVLAGIAVVLVIAPWTVRNIRLQHAFVLISTNDGSNLHQGNNPCVADYLARGWDAQWVNCLGEQPEGLSEVEASMWHRDRAIDYLRDHPGDWPHLFFTKFWVLWTPVLMPYEIPPDADMDDDAVLEYHTASFEAARVLHVLTFAPLLLLGLIGWVLAARAHLPIGPLLAVMAAVTIAYLVFHPSTRYRAPADPFLFVLSAYAVVRIWMQVSKRRIGISSIIKG